jgi:O-antigen/teichoic acid export membrane protein
MLEEKSRTDASIRNVYFSLFSQIANILLNYICRYVFVRVLSQEYLGVNGLFTNILTVFSLAELGIGSAIVYAMYKPIANKNVEKVQAYMDFYKKCYAVIAIVILIIGLIFLPNLNIFINESKYIPNLKLIYLLYLIDSVFSYLFIYKSAILNAMQNNYICNKYQTIGKFFMSICMIISMLIFKNFIIYLTIQVLFTNNKHLNF